MILLTYFAFQIQTDSVPLTEFEELEAERDELVIERDRLIRERDDLRSQIITLLLRIEELNERIAILLSGNEKDQIAALLLRLKFADAEKDKLGRKIANLEKIILSLKEEIRVLTEQRRLDALTIYLQGVDKQRIRILVRLEKLLRDAGLDVVIVEDQGILRLQEGVLFRVGEYQIDPDSDADRNIGLIADALNSVLPCFTFFRDAAAAPSDCEGTPSERAFIEAVLIEGHTDNTPIIAGGLRLAPLINDNVRLSARRASNTFGALHRKQPALLNLLNPSNQQILASAAFGDSRPIAPNTTPTNRAQNRRIDIRILMFTPITRDALAVLILRVENEL